MGLTLRAQRLRLSWVLVVPFLLLARPTLPSFLLGMLLTVPGLFLRMVAAGFIFKDRRLACFGPYAHLRHPLYVGSFFAGLGLVVASGSLWLLGGYLVLFPWMYGRTIRAEERELEARFGGAYRAYRQRVPAFIPALKWEGQDPPEEGLDAWTWEAPGGSEQDMESEARFRKALFLRNRGWEASLGALVGFLFLWLRMGRL